MTEHESPTSPPLPELQQAQFDHAELQILLRDIEACTQLTEIVAKFSATGYVPDGQPLTMADARRLLLSGEARAVQFRYRFEGTDWWDTIMVLPGGRFRLVRIQHRFDQAAS